MKKRMAAIAVNAALMFVAACGDTGPTGPSPLPGPTTGTPPTTTTPTTTPGGGNDVPQVAGTYRGEGTADHEPVPGGGAGPGTIGDDACTDVEQDGRKVTVELPIDPWGLRGVINSEGRLEEIELTEENTDLHSSNVEFTGDSVTIELTTSPTGSSQRFVMDLDVQRQPAGTPKCDRTGQTARPDNY